MKHKLLSTAAVLLLVLLTWSCTATDDEAQSRKTRLRLNGRKFFSSACL